MENVYTQHTPLFAEVLDPLSKGRLRDTTYPFIDPPMQSGTATPPNPANNPANQRYVLTFIASLAVILDVIWCRPQDVVVFTVGGTTYEEAKYVAKLNSESGPSGSRILLGGTCIHNSSRFVCHIGLFLAIDAELFHLVSFISSSLQHPP